ncbi:MAG: family N-acetyltransferase [Thermoleophilia bacterium]|nr:family N-acetyltransferase [Thermoleophilia bacterium]
MSSPLALPLDDPGWAAFVELRPDATPFHNPVWGSLLAECYGFRAFAFVLREGREIVAGVPVVEVRGPTRKRRWVALPFTDALAPLGTPEHVTLLVEMLDAERSKAGVASLEVRAEVMHGTRTVRGLAHVLALGPRSEDVFATFSKSQVQRNVARAERDGVDVRVAERAGDLLETFYRLHLLTRRRQGVPIQPRRFFSLLWDRMLGQGLGRLFIAELDRNAVAAAVFLEWNGMVVYKFGASDPQSWGSRPNHALFWEAIRRACAEGMSELDFGRTDLGNEGLRAFKASWGTDERELVYTNLGKESGPRTSGRPGTLLAASIRRSPPWVCRVLGERLYRYAG